MDRRHIAAFGIAFAIGSTAALAQTSEPPDFSPMRPKGFESPQATVESNGSEEDAQLLRREPSRNIPGASTSASTYEAAPPPPSTSQEPYTAREPARVYLAPPAPTASEATIGHGLFNREGVNDFGA